MVEYRAVRAFVECTLNSTQGRPFPNTVQQRHLRFSPYTTPFTGLSWRTAWKHLKLSIAPITRRHSASSQTEVDLRQGGLNEWELPVSWDPTDKFPPTAPLRSN